MRSLNHSHKLPFATDGFIGNDIIAQWWKKEFGTRSICIDSSSSEIHLNPHITDGDPVTVRGIYFGRRAVC